MSEIPDRHELAAILEWYQAMGVDSAVDEMATDWLTRGDDAPGATLLSHLAGERGAVARPEPAQRPLQSAARPAEAVAAPPQSMGSRPQPANRPAPAVPTAAAQRAGGALAAGPPDAAETAARTAARAAQSIADLAAAIQSFEGCALKATAKSTCVWRGAATAPLVIVGEAPGRDEDMEGKPFVGRAGQLLDRMLGAIGLSEADVHITNVVYWRPPGNRTPTPHETAVCRPFLERQIELSGASHVLLLGGAAAKQVLDVADGIMRIRGKWHDVAFGTRRVKAMATLHPAYLLRTPAAKRMAWRDLLALKASLNQNSNQF